MALTMPRDWDRSLPTRRGRSPKTATSNADLTLNGLTVLRAEVQHKANRRTLEHAVRESLQALDAFFNDRMTGSSNFKPGATRFWPTLSVQRPVARMRTRPRPREVQSSPDLKSESPRGFFPGG